MTTLDRAALIEKLRIERHRLNTALDRFYGHDLGGNPIAMQAAVLDVATPIRVMVHHVAQTGSISLLHQIDPAYWDKATLDHKVKETLAQIGANILDQEEK